MRSEPVLLARHRCGTALKAEPAATGTRGMGGPPKNTPRKPSKSAQSNAELA
jgi:hypothetical protein